MGTNQSEGRQGEKDNKTLYLARYSLDYLLKYLDLVSTVNFIIIYSQALSL